MPKPSRTFSRRATVDRVGILKRDLFVQGLNLKWQEKVLPTAKSFSDALHQARTAEEQEQQLAKDSDELCVSEASGCAGY